MNYVETLNQSVIYNVARVALHYSDQGASFSTPARVLRFLRDNPLIRAHLNGVSYTVEHVDGDVYHDHYRVTGDGEVRLFSYPNGATGGCGHMPAEGDGGETEMPYGFRDDRAAAAYFAAGENTC